MAAAQGGGGESETGVMAHEWMAAAPTDLCKAGACLRQLLDVVPGGGVIRKAQDPCEAVDGIA